MTIRSDNKFTMQCYYTVTKLRRHMIIIMKFLVVRCCIKALAYYCKEYRWFIDQVPHDAKSQPSFTFNIFFAKK